MTDGRMDGWIDGQTDAAVIHPTGTAAVPRPAGQPLPELGPGSKPQKDQHYGLSEYARCQEHRYQCSLGSTALEHTMQYTYLGLTITASRSFSLAVNALKDQA